MQNILRCQKKKIFKRIHVLTKDTREVFIFLADMLVQYVNHHFA